MRVNVFTRTLGEVRTPLLRWTFILAGAAWLTFVSHPLITWLSGGPLEHARLPAWAAALLLGDSAARLSLNDFSAWVGVLGLGILLPVLLVFYAIYYGSWLVAGEEERGSLSLLLAAPIQRCQLILEKMAVLFLLVLGPALAVLASLWVAVWAGWLHYTASGPFTSFLDLFLLGLVFGALALALGSLTGRRAFTQNLVLGFAIVSLLLSRLPSGLAGRLLHLISPFHYYRLALDEPVFSLYSWILAGLVVLFLGLSWAIFEHRDLPI